MRFLPSATSRLRFREQFYRELGMYTTKMGITTRTRIAAIRPFVVCGICLFLSACDDVKFKPIHGDPSPTPKKTQPSVVMADGPGSQAKGNTKTDGTSKAGQGAARTFDDTPEFTFDSSSFGASTFGESTLPGDAVSPHASNHPVLAKEEAIKLVTNLISESVDYKPTLVVWLLDQSASDHANIVDLGEQLSAPYAELTKAQPAESDELLTAVVTFGEKVEFTIDPPTADSARVIEAMTQIKVDESAKEMTFSAVKAAVEKFLPFRTKQGREVILIVVTDEAGDDAEMVDSVVSVPRRRGIPVYVLGVPAPFGRSAGMAQTVEAAADYRPSGAWQPIRQGPESRQAERIQLGFWGGANDLNLLESGFGPFGLERLAVTSGGRFLALRPSGGSFSSGYGSQWPAPNVPRFDPQKMRRYAPDNTTREEYQKILDGNAACRALTDAARLSELELLAFPDQQFVKQSEAQLTTLLGKAQQVAAKLEPAIIELHETLKKGEKDREKLTSPRWQAGFDLAMGRACAARARIEGYNAMLAAIKRGRNFENASSNTWVLESADTIEASTALKRLVDDAKKYLQRVATDHPGTPWALIAERELMMPIGWKWSER